MASKARNVSDKKGVTLKAIEEQLEEIKGFLKKRDEKVDKSRWQSLSTAVGLPVFLVGIVGFLGVTLASNPNFAAKYWLVVMLFGAVVILIGFMVAEVLQRNSIMAKK